MSKYKLLSEMLRNAIIINATNFHQIIFIVEFTKCWHNMDKKIRKQFIKSKFQRNNLKLFKVFIKIILFERFF